ncbi:MAG: AAA family ATPase [Candidatus Heimdallarchaeota archaeon]|nr:AAA family ATPase [Candidatus Heimdallarchaeota archaeon]
MTNEDHWSPQGLSWYSTALHVHTPASHRFNQDFSGDLNISPEAFLTAVVEAGLDVIGVTDHNNCDWIDPLKEAKSNTSDIRIKQLTILPGVEIKTNDGVHVLAIFDEDKPTTELVEFIRSIGLKSYESFQNDQERKNSCTDPIWDLKDGSLLDKIIEEGGLPILPHINRPNGFYHTYSESPNPRDKLIRAENVRIFECNQSEVPEHINQVRKEYISNNKLVPFVFINHSDIHSESQFPEMTRWTWIKLGKPSLNSIKQVITAGTSRLNLQPPEPILHSFIKYLSIPKGKFAREGPFRIHFSPHLNTIVGSKGTGKSIIISTLKAIFGKVSQDDQTTISKLRNTIDDGFTIDMCISVSGEDYLVSRGISFGTEKSGRNLILKIELGDPVIEKIIGEGEHAIVDTPLASLFDSEAYAQGEISEIVDKLELKLDFVDSFNSTKINSIKLKIENIKANLDNNRRLLLGNYDQMIELEERIKEKGDLSAWIAEKNSVLRHGIIKNHEKWDEYETKITEHITKIDSGLQNKITVLGNEIPKMEYLITESDPIAIGENGQDDPSVMGADNLIPVIEIIDELNALSDQVNMQSESEFSNYRDELTEIVGNVKSIKERFDILHRQHDLEYNNHL